jgi:hypothetical protein
LSSFVNHFPAHSSKRYNQQNLPKEDGKMKGNRILVGIVAISLGLGVTGSAMAQRGGGGHGGFGGTSMMHRDAQGSAGAAGTREHQRDMMQEHQQLNREEGMERQSRHESARQAGGSGGQESGRNGQPAETRGQRQEHSVPMGHPEGETPPGPNDHASTTAHEAVEHRGEGTGTAAAVHAVNSSQSHADERKEIEAGQ